MAHRVLHTGDALWRPSNQMGVLKTDLATPLGAATMGARVWRLAPGSSRDGTWLVGDVFIDPYAK